MTTVSTLDTYLPEALRGKYGPRSIHLLKIGHVGLALTKGPPGADRRSLTPIIEEFSSELYRRFKESQYVTALPERSGDSHSYSAQLTSGGFTRVSLLNPLELSVNLPNHVRRNYRGASEGPEAFRLSYDGTLFSALADVPRVPVWSDLGQVAREFLEETLDQGPVWKRLETIGPTPIHPDLYLVEVEALEGAELEPGSLMPLAIRRNDLLVLYPSGVGVQSVVRRIHGRAQLCLGAFYTARGLCMSIDRELMAVDSLSDSLAQLMTRYFERNTASAMFTDSGRRIRSVLSRMHGALQRVAGLEVDLKARMKDLEMFLEGTPVLEAISGYLTEHGGRHDAIDRDAQLSWMAYAASEALNLSLIQTTVVASVVGAVVGGLMVLLLKGMG